MFMPKMKPYINFFLSLKDREEGSLAMPFIPVDPAGNNHNVGSGRINEN